MRTETSELFGGDFLASSARTPKNVESELFHLIFNRLSSRFVFLLLLIFK
jgi:hypothetical protein